MKALNFLLLISRRNRTANDTPFTPVSSQTLVWRKADRVSTTGIAIPFKATRPFIVVLPGCPSSTQVIINRAFSGKRAYVDRLIKKNHIKNQIVMHRYSIVII